MFKYFGAGMMNTGNDEIYGSKKNSNNPVLMITIHR